MQSQGQEKSGIRLNPNQSPIRGSLLVRDRMQFVRGVHVGAGSLEYGVANTTRAQMLLRHTPNLGVFRF